MHSLNASNLGVRRNEPVEKLTAILDVAERLGYRTILSNHESEQMKDQVIENSSSLLMINLIKGIRQKQNDYNKVSLYIQKARQHQKSADITDQKVLEERIAMLQDLNSYMDSLLVSKDLLLEKLQQPYAGDYLRIEANHRREACEVLMNAVTRLGQLATDMDNLTWLSGLDTENVDLQALVKQTSTLLAQLLTNAHNLNRLRQSLKSLASS